MHEGLCWRLLAARNERVLACSNAQAPKRATLPPACTDTSPRGLGRGNGPERPAHRHLIALYNPHNASLTSLII